MSIVNKPILLDETGKEIVSNMRTQNALLSAIARKSINSLTSWKDIQAIVRQGLAPEIFNIGDQFIVPWKDVEENKSYEVPLDIVHFGNVELEDGEIVPGMFLQWHYTIPFGIPYDEPEKKIANGNFMGDRFYYVEVNSGKYKLLNPDTDYNIGDKIPDTTTYYQNSIKDPTGEICVYGYNRWSNSAIRQFLNSNGAKGNWWVAKHLGDIAPEELATKAGFMTGFEENFLSCLSPIKVTTAVNYITDSSIGTSEDTYDTFFLASLEQMYVKPQRAGVEGNYFEYWKRATGATKPNEQYTEDKHQGYITYDIVNKITPRGCFLRSATIGTSSSVGFIRASGTVSGNKCSYELRFTPVCVIC